MSKTNFTEILTRIVNEKSNVSEHLRKHEGVTRFQKEQAIHDLDFIQFFLNFLRESASKVLGNDSPVHNEESSQNLGNSRNEVIDNSNTGSFSQMMSTPKIRDDIATPKSFQNLSTSSLKTPKASEPRKSVSRSNPKQRRENFSLSDFISPSPGFSQKSSGKHRSHKKGKRVQLMSSTQFHKHSPNSLPMTDTKSPVNPLYSEASRSISFDVDEDFPALGSLRLPNSKPSRRITPTVVKTLESTPATNSGKSQSIFNGGSVEKSASKSTTADSNLLERELLLQMKLKMKGNLEEKDTKTLDDISPVKKSGFDILPQHVTEHEKLARLSSIYTFYINSFLVPNVIKEFQFITDLLTVSSCNSKLDNGIASLSITGSLCNSSESNAEDSVDKSSALSEILSNVANCIYFAVASIQSLVLSGVMATLSKSTLLLLVQSSRVQTFLTTLPSEINKLIELLDEKEKESTSEQFPSEMKFHAVSGVMFQAETDDRSNFTSDKSFHAFRKHRDMFYVILREYEERKHDLNFNIQKYLEGKIKNLVIEVKSSGTFKHFVRLFVSQMLQEVGQDGFNNLSYCGSFVSENLNKTNRNDPLTIFKQGDPEKYRRLQSRLSTTNSQQTYKPKDILLDQCHFYKEFVSCADSYIINTHLSNELRERISDIETQQVQQMLDDALAETVNTSSVSSALTTMVSSARVLGRFLGFVTFQPYSDDDSPGALCDLSTLKYATSALKSARKNHHELATVPWVVEYLKSVKTLNPDKDPVKEELAEELFNVYSIRAFAGVKFFSTGNYLLCLMVSTLLNSSAFPDDYFWSLLRKFPSTKYAAKNLQLCTTDVTKNENIGDSSPDLCCSELVSISLIYESNPALKDVRSSLLSYNSGTAKSSQSQQPSRKIKPSMEKEQEETIMEKKEKLLQHTLEEHFFRGQPSSLKRTVAFVAERCASNCVKKIRSIFMLDICDEAEKRLLERLHTKEDFDKTDNYAKGMLTSEIVAEMKTLAKDKMHKECEKFCEKSVPQCLEDLSSCETADGVLKIATKIAKKRAVASVHSWLNSRLDELVSMSVKARTTKIFSNFVEVTEPGVCFDQEFLSEDHSFIKDIDSVSSLLQIMKEFTVKMTFENHGESTNFTHTICPTLPEHITNLDVTALINLSSSVLGKAPNSASEDQTVSCMRQMVRGAPHMRNTLILASKELKNRSQKYFVNNVCTES